MKCRLTGRCNQHQKQKFECHLDTPIRYQTAHPEGGFYLKQPILYYSPIYIPIVTQERKKEKKNEIQVFPTYTSIISLDSAVTGPAYGLPLQWVYFLGIINFLSTSGLVVWVLGKTCQKSYM